MNIGIDFHDTLSYAPAFFISMMRNWEHDIYVISGTPASQKDDIKRNWMSWALLQTYIRTYC